MRAQHMSSDSGQCSNRSVQGQRAYPFQRAEMVCLGAWALAPIVADLAERVSVVPPENLRDFIVAALGKLGVAMQMDLVTLRAPAAGALTGMRAHEWRRDPNIPVVDDAALRALLPRTPGGVPDAGHMVTAGAQHAVQQIHFAAVLPVWRDGEGSASCGVLAVAARRDTPVSPMMTVQLQIAAAVLGQALAAHHRHRALERELADARRQLANRDADVGVAAAPARAPAVIRRDELDDECRRECMQEQVGGTPILGRSRAIQRVLEQLQQVAPTESTVLLLGETGTGKELLATQIHESSARRSRPMVRVNCAAIPSTLVESELFGREKGAFTGAITRQIGRFETADRSSIFLDEIGDLPTEVQVKLLRVVEERCIERLGSPRSVPVDVRIIAATHRDLEKRIAEDAFREDLFYRLNVFPIRIPALCERTEDIPLLVWRFVIEFSRTFGKRIDTIARESMTTLKCYRWPGNIRELRNVVERAMIVAEGPCLTITLPAIAPSTGGGRVRLEEVEREHIRHVLDSVRWRIRGVAGAADQLGLRPTTLETRMAKLGLTRPNVG